MDLHLISRIGNKRNYTGFLTKTIIYASTFVLFIGAFGLTISSIIVPDWVSYYNEQPSFRYSYGLHRRCSSLTNRCEEFPQSQDCHGYDRYFCSMWRSVGFLMSFAVVLQGMTLVSYLIVIPGNRRLREMGWKTLSCLIILSAIAQVASVAIVAYLYNNEDRFFAGWILGSSWVYCTLSWAVSAVCAGWLIIGGNMLPSERGYQLIPSNPAELDH